MNFEFTRVSGEMSGHASYRGVKIYGYTNGRCLVFFRSDSSKQIWMASISQNGDLFSGLFVDNRGVSYPWYGVKDPVN